jgi:hypothetical protein
MGSRFSDVEFRSFLLPIAGDLNQLLQSAVVIAQENFALCLLRISDSIETPSYPGCNVAIKVVVPENLMIWSLNPLI